MSKQAQKIYGIDLGTTYSSIAHVDEHGKAVLIQNAESSTSTPSVVFFDGDEIIVGDVAKESAALYPHDVVTFVKRSMGEPNFLFENKNQSYHAEEISNYIIRKIVQDAEQNTGDKIKDIVITCPRVLMFTKLLTNPQLPLFLTEWWIAMMNVLCWSMTWAAAHLISR